MLNVEHDRDHDVILGCITGDGSEMLTSSGGGGGGHDDSNPGRIIRHFDPRETLITWPSDQTSDQATTTLDGLGRLGGSSASAAGVRKSTSLISSVSDGHFLGSNESRRDDLENQTEGTSL
jgi:hypothetical protein